MDMPNSTENIQPSEKLITSFSVDLLSEEFSAQDRLNQEFIKKQLQRVPYAFRVIVKNTYNRLWKLPKRGEFIANTYFRELGKFCRNLPIDITWNESQLKLVAKSRADMCYSVASNMLNQGDEGDEVLQHLESILLQNNLKSRKGKFISGDIARYCCEKWWSKKLRRLQAVSVEELALHIRVVSKQNQIYISDISFANSRERKRRNDVFLSSLEAINEQGDCIDLADIAKSTTANPVNRRNELMARLHGFEVYADKHGYVADFLTITCPSRMHSVHNTGKPNDKYDGTTPKQAQTYFASQWAKTRSQLDKLSIDYFGFRVVEPHHDGTPHWHLLVFMKPEQQYLLRSTIKHYALQIDGNEKGAQKYRFKIEPICKSKGSAVGYIAKYISKNIDGYGVENDSYGKPANISACRICEWSSLWGIRQFQQFGGPPVTIWREARRLALTEQVKITPVWLAADKGDWCEFIEALGGVHVKRKDLPVSIVKEFIETEGEYWEPIGYVIKGLTCQGEIYLSRHHQWKIQKKNNASDYSNTSSNLGQKKRQP
jgi:hypothetical protein